MRLLPPFLYEPQPSGLKVKQRFDFQPALCVQMPVAYAWVPLLVFGVRLRTK